jgi:hypothetical protein
MIFDGRSLGDAGVGNEDIQAIPGGGSDLASQFERAVRSSQIRLKGLGLAAVGADFINERFRLSQRVAVVGENSGARAGKRQSRCASNATRRSGYESGLWECRSHNGLRSTRLNAPGFVTSTAM